MDKKIGIYRIRDNDVRQVARDRAREEYERQ